MMGYINWSSPMVFSMEGVMNCLRWVVDNFSMIWKEIVSPTTSRKVMATS